MCNIFESCIFVCIEDRGVRHLLCLAEPQPYVCSLLSTYFHVDTRKLYQNKLYISSNYLICTTSKARLKDKNMGAFDSIYTDPVSPLLRPETPLCMSQQREVKEFLRNSHFLQLARTFNFVKNVVFWQKKINYRTELTSCSNRWTQLALFQSDAKREGKWHWQYSTILACKIRNSTCFGQTIVQCSSRSSPSDLKAVLICRQYETVQQYLFDLDHFKSR